VPTANWLLMVGTLLTVVMLDVDAWVRPTVSLSPAPCWQTTVLLYFMVTRRWHWPLLAAVPLIAVFGAVDCGFLVATR